MRILAFVLALSAASLPAAAQPPFRVQDIRTSGTGGTDSWPWGSEFVEIAGTVYFNVSDGIHGMELWASDGTEAGTRLVKDLCPGVCAGLPRGLTAVGSTLYFSADDGAHGSELWKSDGTTAGTVIVADLIPGLAGSSPGNLAELGGKLLFSALTPALGREPWTSDGTAAGTVLLRDIEPGGNSSSPAVLARLGGRLFLSAFDATHGFELWVTDGTPAGTVLVADIDPAGNGLPADGQPGLATVLGSRLVFSASDGATGLELWASDGTAAGTARIRDIEAGAESSFPGDLTTWGDAVYFSAATAAAGRELWKSDGTEAGTVQVADIHPGGVSSSPRELAVAGGRLFFRAFDAAHGSELWASDGSEAGTALVKDIRPGTDHGLSLFVRAALTAVGTDLLFAADDGVAGLEVWKSDGTEAGTVRLADLNPGPAPSFVGDVFGSDRRAVIAGRWYFRAYTGGDGLEVYVSDGTTAGTHKLREINTQASAFEIGFFGDFSGPDPFADLAGTLFFPADDGLAGSEVWKSDGTAAGTSRVADLEPGPNPSFPYDFAPLPGSAVFSASPSVTWRELYRSDGTAGGSGFLMDFEPANSSSGGDPQQLTPWAGKVWFHAPRPGGAASVHELWKTDGTPTGTVPVVDPFPAEGPRSSGALVPFGSRLYFAASTPATGNELWSTDGTTAGTARLADLRPGALGSQPLHLAATAASPARLFFSADDGTAGREPWVTDGTVPGTFRLKDVRPGSAGSIPPDEGFPQGATLAAAAGPLFFFVADDGTAGEELWRSDGTAAGTMLVKDLRPGAAGSEPRWLTASGNKVFFAADDGSSGRELWVSDGTAAGTFRVLDIVPGAGSSLPLHLADIAGHLLFSAGDTAHGRELWVSRGTAATTRRLSDLAPGPLPSSPLRFTASGPNVYFAATDGTTGFELYALPKAALGTRFYTLPPCRAADTRSGSPLATGVARTFPVAGVCGIPATATSLALNLTAVTPTGDGFLTAWPAGSPMPLASTLNFRAGQVRANNAVLPVSPSGLAVITSVSGTGQMHLILDVVGYFE